MKVSDLLIGVAVGLLLVGSFFLGRICAPKGPEIAPEPQVDTVYLRDTITVSKPIYLTRYILDTLYYPVPGETDTLWVPLPREQVEWHPLDGVGVGRGRGGGLRPALRHASGRDYPRAVPGEGPPAVGHRSDGGLRRDRPGALALRGRGGELDAVEVVTFTKGGPHILTGKIEYYGRI